VIVTVELPVAAALLAVRVSTLDVVALVGLKAAVTPLGRPDADSATLPVNPFCGAIVTVLVPAAPCVTVTLEGAAERVKFCTAAAFTVSASVAVFVRVPDVPVIVTVTVPVAAEPLAVRVSTLDVEALAGLKDAVTPLGRPDADNATLPVNPFCGAIVTVLVPAAPCVTVTLEGAAERVKFCTAAAFTVSASVAVFVRVPDVPVIVTVTVPVAAELLAVRVNTLDVVALAGLKAAVTPLGRPDADNATLPVNPFCGAIVTVLVPAAPCVTVALVGDAERVKFGDRDPVGQLLTRFAAFTVPIPVAKSQPVAALNAGL
jgi:hypothetical protein